MSGFRLNMFFFGPEFNNLLLDYVEKSQEFFRMIESDRCYHSLSLRTNSTQEDPKLPQFFVNMLFFGP